MASITKTTKTAKTSKAVKTTKTIKTDKSNSSKSTASVNTTNEYPTYEFSICIPRVFKNLEDQVVIDTFNTLFGSECVEKVDFYIPPNAPKDAKFKKAFVHFNNMPENEDVQKFKQSIENTKEGEEPLKVSYDMNYYGKEYYWICLPNLKHNKSNKPEQSAEEKPKFVPKMTIGTAVPNDKNKSWGDIEEEEEENKSAAEESDDDSDEEE